MKLPKNLLVNDSKTVNGISCLSLDFNNLQKKKKKRVKCKVNRSKFQKLITFRFWSCWWLWSPKKLHTLTCLSLLASCNRKLLAIKQQQELLEKEKLEQQRQEQEVERHRREQQLPPLRGKDRGRESKRHQVKDGSLPSSLADCHSERSLIKSGIKLVKIVCV